MLIGIERLTCLQTLPYFIVSRDQNCLVGQLGGLKNLRGELRLYNLNEVENIEEASQAKLCEKSNIQHLLLKWSNNENQRIDRNYNDEDVMEGLEAHPNLKELTIDGFMGKKFASWITMMTNLVKVTMKDCNRCEVLPPLGHLRKLKMLVITTMENIKVFGDGICETPKAVTTTMYPSLTELILFKLPKLEEWVEAVKSRGDNEQSVFPKLESLEIKKCPRLRKIPNSCFSSLKKLEIEDLNGCMIVGTITRNVSSLTCLKLVNINDGGDDDSPSSSCSCSNMESVMNVLLKNNLMSLASLYLTDCKGLKSLTLGVTLESLSVYRCPHLISINFAEGSSGLKSLSIGGIPSFHLNGIFTQVQSFTLEFLVLGHFSDELDEFPWPFSSSSSSSSGISFPNLIWLELDGWEKVKSIPLFEQLHFSTFPALTRLIIVDFKGVKALPDSIAKLPSLKKLFIDDCDNLESLPTFDESHCLECLEINGCPVLKERYREGSGLEWFKSQRIPPIYWDES